MKSPEFACKGSNFILFYMDRANYACIVHVKVKKPKSSTGYKRWSTLKENLILLGHVSSNLNFVSETLKLSCLETTKITLKISETPTILQLATSLNGWKGLKYYII